MRILETLAVTVEGGAKIAIIDVYHQTLGLDTSDHAKGIRSINSINVATYRNLRTM